MLLLVVLLSLASAPACASLDEEAGAFVGEQGDQLLEILGLPAGEERRDEFAVWLTDVFNLEELASLALGAYKASATEEQLDAYDVAFADYIAVTYEARFDTFTGYDFSVTRTRPMSDDEAVVRTNIVGPQGNVYVVDFRVQQGEAGPFQVTDIAVEGLSMLKTQRDEFSAVIQRDGIDGLIEVLKDRAKEVAASNQ